MNRIVDLLACKKMLLEWEEVRKCIAAGNIKGWAFWYVDQADADAVVLGGAFKDDKAATLRAAMRISIRLNRESDFSPLEISARSGS